MRWKWIAGTVLFIMASITAAIWVIASTYDFNDLKPQVTRAVKAATGRELSLNGDIDLKFGLTPRLRLEDVRFQNASWGSRPEMVNVRRVEVQVPLLSLIRGSIAFRHLVLIEPDILIETDKTGRTNLACDAPGKDTASMSPEDANSGIIELPPLLFEDLQIEKGKLTYKNIRENKTLAVKIENLKARATDFDSPLTLSLRGEWNGTPFECESTTGALKKLAEPHTDWPLKLTVQALDATLAVDGTIQDLSGLSAFQLQLSLRSRNTAGMERLMGKPFPFKGPMDISARLMAPGPDRYAVSDLKAKVGDNGFEGSMTADFSGKVPQLSAFLTSETLDLRCLFPEKEDNAERGREKVFPSDPLPV